MSVKLKSNLVSDLAIVKYFSNVSYGINQLVIDENAALYKSLVNDNIGNDLSNENYWELIPLGEILSTITYWD